MLLEFKFSKGTLENGATITPHAQRRVLAKKYDKRGNLILTLAVKNLSDGFAVASWIGELIQEEIPFELKVTRS